MQGFSGLRWLGRRPQHLSLTTFSYGRMVCYHYILSEAFKTDQSSEKMRRSKLGICCLQLTSTPTIYNLRRHETSEIHVNAVQFYFTGQVQFVCHVPMPRFQTYDIHGAPASVEWANLFRVVVADLSDRAHTKSSELDRYIGCSIEFVDINRSPAFVSQGRFVMAEWIRERWRTFLAEVDDWFWQYDGAGTFEEITFSACNDKGLRHSVVYWA